ncbi:uncharacterized protein LOC6523803 [Drosophila yakuba]|uniref:Nucleolar 27S pre-rRNA processing Urb2/Npa2 C-terminal domain-containing protein n=1 Tax=Drosophila yakuba TaxID=7245 RepID=B4PX00_DROYA|nr:uncharacterized protein LOC6523803 [Drosophila yakuba]EDX00786.1 uncharacterized protein Dyak_GE16584 [Drosophila yakuba]
MDTGEALKSWLTEENKPFAARVEFALKVWQSVEFPYPNKYEVVADWLSQSLGGCKDLPTQQLKDFLSLRAQPGWVTQTTKSQLIHALYEMVSREENANESALELLPLALSSELLQDALRSSNKLLFECYGSLFRCHQKCIELRGDNKDGSESQDHWDAEFVVPVIKQLAEIVRRSQQPEKLLEEYDAQTVRPLVELLLTLKTPCLDELAALEKQINAQFTIERTKDLPLHVSLILLEARVINNRFQAKNLSSTIQCVFNTEKLSQSSLQLAAHLLVSLRKYDVSLEFKMPKKKYEGITGFAFVSDQLLQLVRQYKKSNLGEVLILLCSALRYNPLLLEQNVYQITVWVLTSPKENAQVEELYSEYLILLLDMFRRLSRAERFIMNLLKALREWLGKYTLDVPHSEAKKRRTQDSKTIEDESHQLEDRFLGIIFSRTPLAAAPSANDAFKQLCQTWPSHSAGVAFTRLMSHLMSKPSLVIWKTLLHSFAELLDEDQPKEVLPENLDFARELHAALLCQYLSGTRLAEQVQLYQLQVEQQLQHTSQVLEQFGRLLLSQEHNRRLMNAFLECTERASGFELLLAYYWPDGFPASERPLQLRGFLPTAEWTLIQQRVYNFGKSCCRQRLQRLELQLVESGWLLKDQRTANCSDALAELVAPQQLFRLSRAQKQLRLHQRKHNQHLEPHLNDAESIEVLALQLLKEYGAAAKDAKAKGSLLVKLKLEEQVEESSLILFLREHASTETDLHMPAAQELVETLQGLPLAQLPGNIRSRLWLVIFVLYRDLSLGQQEESAKQILELLIDLMHFGHPLPICSYFPRLSELLLLIPSSSTAGWSFYETLFARCIRRQGAGSEAFLASCTGFFRDQLAASNKLPAEERRLLLLAIETLSSVTGAQGRRLQSQLQPLIEIYGEMVTHKFRSKKKEASAYKEFVDCTLSGYATYVSNCINRVARQEREKEQQEKKAGEQEGLEKTKAEKKMDKKKKAKLQEEEENGTRKELQPIDENFRRICKIYIGHSLNYRDANAIRLLNVALTHRQRLHLDPDEIEFVLSSYWRQLNADIEMGDIFSTSALDCLEPAIKLIIGYKTNEDFLLLLRRLSAQVEQMARPASQSQHAALQNVLTLLALFAKCSLSSVKGAMLNEHFEMISVSVSLRLPEPKDAAYCGHALRLLEAQRNLAGNRTVPLTGETLDCLLGSMLDVDIKHLIRNGGSWQHFVDLYAALTDNLVVLLKQHTNLMSDRAAQLSALCQDLIQAIVGYRSERKQTQDISETELDGLADLGLKLATVMATVSTTQALAVKRVAPFLLIFTIRQMVATERPTTLFEKIKVHIVRVCHELIGMCDHRAGHFILRSSNEAGARMYEGLVKDHEKYHKFRGKV